MQTIGAFDAKTHFSEILNDVEHGKSIIITRHGRRIAIITPISEPEEVVNRFEIAKKGLRKMRQGVTLGSKITIKKLIEEGRR